VGEAPKNTTARKPAPLNIFQNSLALGIGDMWTKHRKRLNNKLKLVKNEKLYVCHIERF
jgi:hypothetical protein